MIEDCEKGKINMIITKDLSRLGRNYIETGKYTEEYFPEHNIRFIAIEELAKVVRLIFRKCLEGLGTKQIANYLSKEKIPIPSDYTNKTRGIKSLNYGLWQQSTVIFILDNEVYTGTVVQGKTKKLSFKSKKMVKVPKEDWIRIYNVHEAIVAQEDFDRV